MCIVYTFCINAYSCNATQPNPEFNARNSYVRVNVKNRLCARTRATNQKDRKRERKKGRERWAIFMKMKFIQTVPNIIFINYIFNESQ